MTKTVPQIPLFAFMACMGTKLLLLPMLRYAFICVHFNIIASAPLSIFFLSYAVQKLCRFMPIFEPGQRNRYSGQTRLRGRRYGDRRAMNKCRATKLCTVAPTVWNLLHLTHLAPRILQNFCTLGKRFLLSSKPPERLVGPPNLLFIGYRCPVLRLKRPEPEVDHSPLFSAEVKNEQSYNSPPPYPFMTCIGKTLSLCAFYICGSVRRNSRLKKSNKMQQYADIYLLLNYLHTVASCWISSTSTCIFQALVSVHHERRVKREKPTRCN